MINLNRLNIEVYGESSSKIWMIIGEGTVFLIILLVGFSYTIKAFKKELELSKQQSNFLLAITHELKTPLSSIKLFFQTLKRPELKEEKKLELIDKGIQDTNRLNNMIENLLLSARFEGNALYIQAEKINLNDFLNKIVSNAQSSYGVNHVISIEIPSTIEIVSDSHALSSIFINLLENACKYSPKESNINVVCLDKDDIVLISVSDQGMGIKEKDQNNIFNKFYRVENENTRPTKGSGLGLYIVSELSKMINGSIDYKLNQPKGSIFTLTLPTQQK